MLFCVLGAVAITSLDSSWYDKITRYGIYNGNTIEQILHNIAQGDITRIHRAMVDAIKSGMSLSEARKAVTDEMVKTKRFIRHEINSIINGVVNDTAMAFAAGNWWTIVLPGRKQSKKRNGISPNEWQENHPYEYKAFLRRALFPGETKYALDIYDGLFAIGKPGVKLPEDGRMDFIITHASSEGDSLNDVQLRATVIQN